MTYEEVGKDFATNCAIIENSEHSKGLNEPGFNNTNIYYYF